MKVDLATVSAPQKAKSRPIPCLRRSGGHLPDEDLVETNIRMSPSVIVNIVQASDLLLLLFCGLLTSSMLAPPHALRPDGSLFFATITGSLVAGAFFSRAGAYLLPSLCSLGKQLKLMPIPLLAGVGSMIVCLFLTRDDGLVPRRWPFLWLFLSATLLVASRCYLSRLLHRWTESGRLARRVAVIGAGEFSREFIERLRSRAKLLYRGGPV